LAVMSNHTELISCMMVRKWIRLSYTSNDGGCSVDVCWVSSGRLETAA
jgi:hypothetical protein